MNMTKLAADLCAIIEQQNHMIETMAMELAQLGALHHAEEIAATRKKYAEAIGTTDETREDPT